MKSYEDDEHLLSLVEHILELKEVQIVIYTYNDVYRIMLLAPGHSVEFIMCCIIF